MFTLTVKVNGEVEKKGRFDGRHPAKSAGGAIFNRLAAENPAAHVRVTVRKGNQYFLILDSKTGKRVSRREEE